MKLRAKRTANDDFPHHAFVHKQVFEELTGHQKSELPIATVTVKGAKTWCFLASAANISLDEIQLPSGLGFHEANTQSDVDVDVIEIDDLPIGREVVFTCAATARDFSDTRIYLENVFSSWPLPLFVGQEILQRARSRGGNKSFTCRVQGIDGSETGGPVVIRDKTEVRMMSIQPDDEESPTGFEQVGGLENEIRIIREIIEFQFDKRAELKKLGLRPTKGILLTGPPGTGKTLIARSVASEFGVVPYSLNATELLSEFVGTGERRLREIFDAARKKERAIIFIDEIDVLTASRDTAQEDFSRRLVNQFLPLLDGIEDSENVTVIGATNRPHAIDPAFRRPGRFDQELTLSIPAPQALKAIFEVHTKRFATREIDLNAVIAECAGFVGADVEAAVRNAASDLLKLKMGMALTTDALLTGVRAVVPAIRRNFQGEIYFPASRDSELERRESRVQSFRELLLKTNVADRPKVFLFDTGSLVSNQSIGSIVAEASEFITVQLDVGGTDDSYAIKEAFNRIAIYFKECAVVFAGCHFAGIRRGVSLYSEARRILRGRCRLIIFAGTHFEDETMWQEMADGNIQR